MNSILEKSHKSELDGFEEKPYEPFYLRQYEGDKMENPEFHTANHELIQNRGIMQNHTISQTHIQEAMNAPHGLSQQLYMENLDDFINPQSVRDSHAFPPTEFPQNTPNLEPKPRVLETRRSSGHIESAMFQSPILPSQDQRSFNQEHLYQKQKQRSRQKSTPLVSPAVTPLEVHAFPGQIYANNLHDFEPLTSPALKAQLSSSSERRRSSSTFNGDYNSGTPAKRRTPHSTPNMQAANAKPKRSPSLRKVHQHFEPLPASSHENPNVASAEGTPMLPPQGKKVEVQGFGPGLMSFTMNRLAEQQSPQYGGKQEDYEPKDDYEPKSEFSHRYVTSSSETSPVIEAQTDEHGKRDRPTVKKASHKLAEQGRRNRMNQAVHELSRLIPREIRDKVAVPSKATTVELASTYIRQLVQELEAMKNGGIKQEEEAI